MLILPPDYPEIEGQLIFLAGPIQGAPDWQQQAIDYLQQKAPALHIASPKRQYLGGAFDYETQVDWESYHLKRAAQQGVILFFLAKEQEHFCERAYAQTTRFELAEWKTRQLYEPVKIVIGLEHGFTGERYIKHRLQQDNPQIPMVYSLALACEKCIELACFS